MPGLDPARLGAAERAALLQEIEIRGATLVAEEKVGFGTTPSLTPRGLVPKPYARAPVRDGHRQRLRGAAGRPRHDRRSRPRPWRSAHPTENRATCGSPATRRRRPTSACGGRPSRRRRCGARRTTCRAAPPTICSGSAAIRSAPTGPCACCAFASAVCRRTAPRARSCAPAARRSRSCCPRTTARFPASGKRPMRALIEQLARNLMTSVDWYYGLPRTLDNIHRVASLTRDRLSLEAWRTLNDFYASRRWRADAMPTSIGDSLAPARRRPARAGGLPRPDAREHDAQLRLVVPGHGPAAVAGAQSGRAAARHIRQGQEATTRAAACCSCWSWPTASSPTARAIGWRRCCRLLLDLLLIDESNPRSIAFQLEALSAAHRLPAAVGRGRRRASRSSAGPVAADQRAPCRRHGARQSRAGRHAHRACRSCWASR